MKSLESFFKTGKRFFKEAIIAGLAYSFLNFSSCIEHKILPPENNAPIILTEPETEVNEEEFYKYSIRAKDPDKDNLSCSLNKGPSWLSLASFGEVEGISRFELGGYAPEVSKNKEYSIRVSVSDGEKSDSRNYTLTVKDVSSGSEKEIHHLSGGDLNDLDVVKEDELKFSKSVDFSKGDIISAGISSITPNGLCREITNISSDKTKVYTKQAVYEQIVKNASFSFSKRLSSSNAHRFLGKKGVSLVSDGVNFYLNLEDVILFDLDGNKNTTNDQIVANGTISFSSDLFLDFVIKNYKLHKLSFENIVEENVNLQISSGLECVIDKEITVATFSFSPFIAGTLPGTPIPIIISPEIEVNLGLIADMSSLEARVSQEASFNAGLSYENGSWNKIWNFSNDFDFSSSDFSSDLYVKAYVGPKLSFLLYGVAGPFGTLNEYLKIKSDKKSWSLYGGLETFAGVEMKVFSKKVADYYTKVSEWEEFLTQGDVSGQEEPGTEGKIAFVSERDGNGEIYIMNPDGSNQKNVTNNPANDFCPSLREGGELLFVSDRDGNYEIYRGNINNSGVNRLTYDGSTDSYPDWSPKGDVIFYSTRNGNNEIFLMNANGSAQRKLDLPNISHGHPRWSPVNDEITVTSFSPGESMDIYLANRGMSYFIRLTENSAKDIQSSFSPDGEYLAFVSDRDGDYEIYTMDRVGNNITKLTHNTAQDQYPVWSPDGKKIAFCSNKTGNYEIWIMDKDGSNQKRITNNSADDYYPYWSKK